MTPLERAAQALEQSLGPCLDRMITSREDLEKAVRAVLTAIREPSESMLLRLMYELHANVPEDDRPGFARCDFSEEQWSRVEAAYAAMIDAMLAEGE